MKNLLVGLTAVLLLAGTALGVGTATVLGPAEVDPEETFEIQVDLQADELMVSYMFDGIMATGGAVPVSLDYVIGDAVGWDSNNALSVSLAAFPVGPVGTISKEATAGSGVCVSMQIQAPNAPDSFFDVYVTSGIYGNEMWEDVDLTAVEPLSIHITPEPVSALLLLAGIPMLRRRR